MAQKRALIAAVLIATNASDYFTQDMEDFIDADFFDAPVVEKKKEPEPAAPDVPLDNLPDMSLELAESETNSKGVKYGELKDSTLKFMFKAIAQHERNEDNIRKMDAIRVILAARGTAA
jgi:hypothetical protein